MMRFCSKSFFSP